MSARRNLRKRTVQKDKHPEDTPKKIIKEAKPANELENDNAQTKQPIIAPNGKIFYPCQYCTKVFPQKTTSITHMKKCPNKNSIFIPNKCQDTVSKLNNNTIKTWTETGNSTETNGNSREKSEPKIRISHNITVRTAETELNLQKQLKDPSSVYDYDEQDDEIPENKTLKENDEDAANNRQCKYCKELFESPLDLLRHNRFCNIYPKTILAPDEIEKYFDSPNRDFCPICKKPIKTRNFKSVFIKHLLVHTTGLTIECPICKMKFRRRDHMRAHEKRHIISG